MRKGQAAMEFLMTYGWAILVVLVAIGALAYFGVLSPAQFLPEKCTIATGSGLYCGDHQADSQADGNGRITLRIQNMLDKAVDIAAGDAKLPDVEGGACVNTGTPYNIPADSTKSVVFLCAGLAANSKVKSNIEIKFTPTGGLKKTAAGQLVTTASDLT